MKVNAAIFDLDGTLIDNNSYHLQSWLQYLKDMNRQMSEEEYKANVNGRTNKDVIEYIYQRKMDDEEAMKYAHEKEAIYRQLYAPYIKPVAGLLELLEKLRSLSIPMAIATSGIQVNIDFLFEHIPIRSYFDVIVNSAHISKGKPDPEIYIKTAELLKVSPAECLVFEDAVVGINSAKAAGMKVVGVLTTHKAEELSGADILIKDFSELVAEENSFEQVTSGL
ncbi:HAD family hydrolase [Flavisolibacter ginsengisoli]|jgi:beta-phosphoglucomutase family hydrolase|uniref:Beta-phosphoglucomutase n=1 Tax=Flavisolibacter ginsengisoli DSM 18119 TaxID=1121884 RepID=A0A1M4T2N9_9BACT|nr:HAD family phosphatase [Flavisolibacter ginsengisoli]SHE38733.1 haloacid dehalogenase superfamily, subfamily IA, variant 3 with third motif having DD or ED/haloacid dehalogenase superfamily, subfamily IA, variant 1 with third motif having Dx(3-4)D or Dx(3-4)E/beta-phosphoglucomutase family hydrolase [Flavisolibacter ginsengisoli DSM 18119]